MHAAIDRDSPPPPRPKPRPPIPKHRSSRPRSAAPPRARRARRLRRHRRRRRSAPMRRGNSAGAINSSRRQRQARRHQQMALVKAALLARVDDRDLAAIVQPPAQFCRRDASCPIAALPPGCRAAAFARIRGILRMRNAPLLPRPACGERRRREAVLDPRRAAGRLGSHSVCPNSRQASKSASNIGMEVRMSEGRRARPAADAGDAAFLGRHARPANCACSAAPPAARPISRRARSAPPAPRARSRCSAPRARAGSTAM